VQRISPFRLEQPFFSLPHSLIEDFAFLQSLKDYNIGVGLGSFLQSQVLGWVAFRQLNSNRSS